jgi:hypothetical protein
MLQGRCCRKEALAVSIQHWQQQKGGVRASPYA